MKFIHEIVDLPELTAVQTDRGRLYNTPSGAAYPSITTVLGARPEKKRLLAEWRARVGEQEANKVSAQASRRGTSIHNMMEKYFLGGDPIAGEMPSNVTMFNSIRSATDKHLTHIYAMEAPLYSDKMQIAGRCDLVGKWAGMDCIIDFKTSKRLKEEAHIDNYLLQASAYSLMFEELTARIIPGIVVLIGVDDEVKPQMFCRYRDKYVDELCQVILEYYTGRRLHYTHNPV